MKSHHIVWTLPTRDDHTFEVFPSPRMLVVYALIVVGVATGSHSAVAQPFSPESPSATVGPGRYWELGTGIYFAGCRGRFTELDAARADWLLLRFPGLPSTRETTELLNRLIRLNPRLKIMVRVWPLSGLSPYRESRYQATFYEYFYADGVKEKLLEEIRRQIRVVLDHIEKPENFVAMTFLEELPQHFTDMAIFNEDGKTTWAMEAYREKIEAEIGKKFHWNDEGRRWWGRKYTQAFGEIHAAMKDAGEGRLVIYWQQTGYKNLDHYPSDTPLSTSSLVPIQLREIVKLGLCDGVFAYPNTDTVWENDALRFARERGWLFFSQLSHAPWMRSDAWLPTLRRVRTRVPQNLGTVWYCEGNCIHPLYESQRRQMSAARLDKSIPESQGGPAMIHFVEHTRRLFAQAGVGMDVVERHLKPELQFDYFVDSSVSGSIPRIVLQIHNTRETSWYTDPQAAVLKNAVVQLFTPPGIELIDGAATASVELGEIEADGYRVVVWPVRLDKGVQVSRDRPLWARITAANGPTVDVRSERQDAALVAFEPRSLYRSGEAWVEPNYRDRDERFSAVNVRVLQGEAKNPAITQGSDRIRYDGTLVAGEALLIARGSRRALILPSNLVVDDTTMLRDVNGPHGARGWSEGEELFRLTLMKPGRLGSRLKVTISGKASGGASSSIRLWGYQPNGWEQWYSEPLLVDAFSEEWQREVTATITLPDGADVRRVVAYRHGGRGTIWYGDVEVTLNDMPVGGVDVSKKLQGDLPRLPVLALDQQVQRPPRFVYTDDSEPTWLAPRVNVQVVPVEP